MQQGADIHIAGLTFDGFDAAFADRAAAVFQATLAQGAGDLALTRTVDVATLDLAGLDFRSADALGRSLARAILHRLAP